MDGDLICLADGGYDSEGYLDGIHKYYYPNGSIGWDDFKNGVLLRHLRWFSNGNRHWMRHYISGHYTEYEWFSSGIKHKEEPHFGKHLHGIRRVWDENGTLIGQVEHVHSIHQN
jgi:antitoxin component YwqK of YwqJK toxin-antitoxin module